MKIAVLMTCHNRRETTLRCLRGLPSDVDVYLVDDGSTDGTGAAVKASFPRVNVIRGGGDLYWAKAMELSWKTCLQHEMEKVGGGGQRKYDGFLWLNDDVELATDALEKLITDVPLPTPIIIVGELVNSKGEVTYGKRGDLFTGNFVFVSRAAYEKLGMICGDYAHAWADSDYAMRAKRAGVRVVSCGIVGKCEGHLNRPSLKGLSLRQRWAMLFNPKGWNLHDLWLYRRRNWGVFAAVFSSAHLMFHVLKGER